MLVEISLLDLSPAKLARNLGFVVGLTMSGRIGLFDGLGANLAGDSLVRFVLFALVSPEGRKIGKSLAIVVVAEGKIAAKTQPFRNGIANDGLMMNGLKISEILV